MGFVRYSARAARMMQERMIVFFLVNLMVVQPIGKLEVL